MDFCSINTNHFRTTWRKLKMGLFGKLIKTTFDVVTLPVDIVKDVATMGGALNDEDIPYTAQKFERLGDDFEEVRDEVDEL